MEICIYNKLSSDSKKGMGACQETEIKEKKHTREIITNTRKKLSNLISLFYLDFSALIFPVLQQLL